MSTTIGPASPLRRASSVLVGVEALALVGVAAWVGVNPLTGADSGAMAAAIVALTLLAALALGWASLALWRGRAWPRGLALTWQVMQAVVGFTVLEWSVAAGIAAVGIAVAAAALLFADARRDVGSTQAPPADRSGSAED